MAESTLTDDLEALLPTDDEVEEYRRRGWYLSRKIVPDAILDAALAGSERYYTEGMDPDGPPIPEQCQPRIPAPPGLRKNDYATLRCRELAALRDVPAIGAIAARLAGADVIRLWHDQLLYKPSAEPGAAVEGVNVGWHTDHSYWKAAASPELLTAWVPFTDITADMGPLMMLDGSNRWGDEGEALGDRTFFRQDLDELEGEIERGGRTLVKVPLLMERGQVSFHHQRTFHGSGPNTSGRPRRSIALHMQPGDNRFSGLTEDDGSWKFHMNNGLVRRVDGFPDYSDPTYCPVLWPPREG